MNTNHFVMCQYPKSDNFHFYTEKLDNKLFLKFCVNILNRITFISTSASLNGGYKRKVCQYPKSDNSHFYIIRVYHLGKKKVCQYPKSDNFHFYGSHGSSSILQCLCVNILNRITFISTRRSEKEGRIKKAVSIS